MTIFFYACEMWTVYWWHARKLNRFHINCLRRLLCITWHDMIPDAEVIKFVGLQSIHAPPKKAQLGWAGHVVRMSDERLPKRLLHGELSEGRKSICGQRKHYKDSLKSSINAFEINNESWEKSYDQTRVSQAEEKRLHHKFSATETSSAIITALPCPNCDRTFPDRIGLITHIRTHRLHATEQ